MSRVVQSDGAGTLRIQFDYDRRLVEVVRSFPVRRWDKEEKYWAVPDAEVVAVVDALTPEGFRFCEVTRRLYQERRGPRAEADEEREVRAPTKSAKGSPDFTVKRLNERVQMALRESFPQSIWLVGEVSGFNKSAEKQKRTVDFQIVEVDERGAVVAQIKATLFESNRRDIERRLRAAGDPFQLEDEIQVRVRGSVDLYVPWGSYRFVVEDIDPGFTVGEAARRREEIRRRLAAEGILERNRIVPLPVVPLRVGLVTSLDSDAYNDVLRTLQESGFAFRVIVHGARVQGRQMEPSVLNALDWLRARAGDLDVLLICRGGGSQTDLAWFDSEPIARAITAFPLPVIVGIGHETDFTALDFVARRAKTPTAAAGLLVERVAEAINAIELRMITILDKGARILRDASSELGAKAAHVPRRATLLIERRRDSLREKTRRLRLGARRELAVAARHLEETATNVGPRASQRLVLEAERVEARSRRLVLLDPRRVVERGYAILRAAAGAVLTDPALAPKGAIVTAEMRRGRLRLRSEGSEEE